MIFSVSKSSLPCRKTFIFFPHSSHVSVSTSFFFFFWCPSIVNYFFGVCLLHVACLLHFFDIPAASFQFLFLFYHVFFFFFIFFCVSFWNPIDSCSAFTSLFSYSFSSCMPVIFDSKFSILFVKMLILVFSWISSNYFKSAIVKHLSTVLFCNVLFFF